jgi:hypothetical protein
MVRGWLSGAGLCRRATRQEIANLRLLETVVWGAGFGSLPFTLQSYIGSVDLPMPEKTHARILPGWRGCGGLLKRLRWFVAEPRVRPHAVVILVDELHHVGAEMFQIAILIGVDFLPFQVFMKLSQLVLS